MYNCVNVIFAKTKKKKYYNLFLGCFKGCFVSLGLVDRTGREGEGNGVGVSKVGRLVAHF